MHVVLETLQWYAECSDKLYDEIAPTGPGQLGLITREAIGVVAAVVPWNFPMLMAAWKLAPALAAGNSVILKPAEQSPLTAIRLAELAAEAGIPDGVFNVLPGFGPTAGKALGLHMDRSMGKYFAQQRRRQTEPECDLVTAASRFYRQQLNAA